MVDGLGNPLRFILSSGNRNDICLAKELLKELDLNGKLILADKGYNSKSLFSIRRSAGFARIFALDDGNFSQMYCMYLKKNCLSTARKDG